VAPYASVEQFLSYYGTDRVRTSIPKDVLAADLEDHLLVRLDASSAYMDSYLKRGGYSTPIDVSAISDAVARSRAESILIEVCCAIVGQQLFIGQRGAGEGQKQARNWAKDWLEDIAANRIAITGLATTSKRIAVVGSDQPSIPNTLFDSIRYPY
jgi:phage gp36-like protein